MNRRGFLTGLLGAGLAALFGWKPKYTPFAWEAEPAWSEVKWSIVHDYRTMYIVDRVGMTATNVTLIPGLRGGYSTSQSGLVQYWRNASGGTA